MQNLPSSESTELSASSATKQAHVQLTTVAKKKKRKLRIILILFVLLAGGGGWGGWKYHSSKEKPTEVETAKVKRRDIIESVVATGNIQPVTRVVINPEVAGEIVELPVKEGQRVNAGDLLVKIRPEPYIASRNVAQANHNSSLANLKLSQANLDKADADFKRTSAMHRDKLISDAAFLDGRTAFTVEGASFERAQHGVEQAKAALDQAEEDLAKTTIVAPISGTITQLRSEKGERVVGTNMMAGTEIMTVAQLDAMEARVEVGEIDVVSIKVGQKARLEVDAFRDDEFTGEVTEIANASGSGGAAGQSSGAGQTATKFQVKIQVQEKEAFRPGMSVTAYIETHSVKDVLSLPRQSLTTRGNKSDDDKKKKDYDQDEDEGEGGSSRKKRKKRRVQEVVFVVDGDRVKKVNVESGIGDDDYAEIKSGLEEGQEVVSGNYRAISRDLKDKGLIKRKDENDDKKDKNDDE
jgi:HlyD family secretion protein